MWNKCDYRPPRNLAGVVDRLVLIKCELAVALEPISDHVDGKLTHPQCGTSSDEGNCPTVNERVGE